MDENAIIEFSFLGSILAWPAVTKYHRLCGLQRKGRKKFIFHSSGAWEPELKVSACLDSGEGSLRCGLLTSCWILTY